VDEIPRNAAGKVDRNLLRQRLQSSGANHPGEDSHRSSPSVSR
jgi:acyl-coenzyme A synthetase/AMP-(fatty) acid ligase